MNIDPDKIIITSVGISDVEAMVACRIQYLTEMQGERPESVVEELKNELTRYFTSGIQNGNVIALVAVFGGKPVAYGAVVLRSVPGDFNGAAYVEGDVLNMYTIPEARRRGISKMLLLRLIDEAQQQGVAKLALHTTVAGEKLYRSVGFHAPVYPYLELELGKK
jgi:GNAT superfamily N-acetyltransferase